MKLHEESEDPETSSSLQATLTVFRVANMNRIKDWAVKGTEYSHMYTHLTLDVIAISQATKFLLASCVPYIKFNRASVSMEHQRMNFNTQRCYSDKKKQCS